MQLLSNLFRVNSFMTEAVIIQKPVHWFLYGNGLRHERVKAEKLLTLTIICNFLQQGNVPKSEKLIKIVNIVEHNLQNILNNRINNNKIFKKVILSITLKFTRNQVFIISLENAVLEKTIKAVQIDYPSLFRAKSLSSHVLQNCRTYSDTNFEKRMISLLLHCFEFQYTG